MPTLVNEIGRALIRVHLSRLVSELHMGPIRRRALADLERRMPALVEDFGDLHPSSLALIGSGEVAQAPVVRLLLPVGAPRALFAGMRTALVFAARLACERGQALEICHFDRPRNRKQQDELRSLAKQVSGIGPDRVSVRHVWSPGRTHPEDLYVATWWETAMAAQIAVRAGVLDAERVLYLVQDYEPEFYPGSSNSALSRATYHAGFRMVVNSAPLAAYLSEREGLGESIEHVFRPELDLDGIAVASGARTPSSAVRITFYGRPGNTRNSYELGVAALKLTARRLQDAGIRADFVSVGEKHPDIRILGGRVRSLGKLGWNEYFHLLAATDVMLSFQQTPHPSHPPLDAVASGAFAVMNDLSRSRSNLSDRLLATESDPVAVAERVVEAARLVQAGRGLRRVDEDFVAGLGRPLADVVSDVAALV